MSDVCLGSGELNGIGIYAARRFEEGDAVVSFELRPLAREDYLALPVSERLFVHSYFGERWLYPEPARFVNHSEQPNTYQDFDRGCDFALRRIEPGELITLNAWTETDRELATFLAAFAEAVQRADSAKLDALVDANFLGWHGAERVTKERLLDALGAVEAVTMATPEWIVGTGRWEAVCSYEMTRLLRGGEIRTGRCTDVLKVIDGNWQLVYRHLPERDADHA